MPRLLLLSSLIFTKLLIGDYQYILLKLILKMDNFNDLAALYVMNIIDDLPAYNPRHGFSVKYDPFTQCDRLFLKNYRLTKDLVRQLITLVTPYIEPERRSSSIKLSEKVISY